MNADKRGFFIEGSTPHHRITNARASQRPSGWVGWGTLTASPPVRLTARWGKGAAGSLRQMNADERGFFLRFPLPTTTRRCGS
jgi:hypothetical protein